MPSAIGRMAEQYVMRAPCRYTGVAGPGTWTIVQLGSGIPRSVAAGAAADVWSWIQASRSAASAMQVPNWIRREVAPGPCSAPMPSGTMAARSACGNSAWPAR